jgi:hypothetical protein
MYCLLLNISNMAARMAASVLGVLAGNISDKEKPSTFFWSFQNNGRLSLSISSKTRVKYSGTPGKAHGFPGPDGGTLFMCP